jgi:ABC-type transporter Mla subunit MlaD
MIVVVGLAAITLLGIGNLNLTRQIVKTCFTDAGGLRVGNEVRIAGVDVGSVRSVHVNPQSHSCPAEIEMSLTTNYDLQIPKDSVAEVQTQGVLGASFVSIDTSHASGPPVERYGYLAGKSPAPPASLDDYMKALEMMVKVVDATSKQVPSQDAPHAPMRPRGNPPKSH